MNEFVKEFGNTRLRYGDQFNTFKEKYLKNHPKYANMTFLDFWLEEKKQEFLNSYFCTIPNLKEFWMKG